MPCLHQCLEGMTERHGLSWQARAEAVRKGEVVSADSFDSNCITPGTPFMARLGAHLRYFVRKKIAEDPAWQRPHVIFSGKLKCTWPHICAYIYTCAYT